MNLRRAAPGMVIVGLTLAGCAHDDRGSAYASPCRAPDGSVRAFAHPSWSRDGSHIVFGEPSTSTILVVDVKRQRLERLTCGFEPTVSPDGTHLALVRNFQIYVTDRRGNHARRITHGEAAGGYSHPSWSPGGRRIAYMAKGDYGITGISVVGVDGRGDRDLGLGDQPAWSPDGARILYRDFARGLRLGLFVMRPDGNRRRHLGRTIDPESAAWAPDGRRIAFTGFDDGRIRILNSRGHGRRLLSGPAYDLAWSPDGKRIAFARTREHGDSSCTGIYVLTVRSGAVRKITPGC